MGYSSRYHVASLVAVFVALAVGILIGAALGSDVVSGTAESLEEQLSKDLDAVRAENEDLRAQLESERAFAAQIAPAVVADRLAGQEVALLGLGDVDTPALAGDVEAALGPAGARLTQAGSVREPPDAAALARALGRGRGARGPEALERLAERAGRRLAGRDELDAELRTTLFSEFSGEPEGLDGAVLVGAVLDEPTDRERAEIEALERGLVSGLSSAGVRLVGAERADADPSSVVHLGELGLPTVDNIDELAGRLALVLVLDGANGAFGTNDGADSLLPELIGPPQ